MKKVPQFLFALFISSTALVTAQSLPSNPVCNLPSTPTVFNPSSQQPSDNGAQDASNGITVSDFNSLLLHPNEAWSNPQIEITINKAWNDIQKFMTADMLNAPDFCHRRHPDWSPYPKQEPPILTASVLYAQCTILLYQSFLTGKKALNYSPNYCAEINPIIETDYISLQALILHISPTESLCIDLALRDFSNMWRRVLEERVGASDIDLSTTPEYLALNGAIGNSDTQLNVLEIEKRIADVNSLEFNTAIGVVKFTPDESIAFDDFRTKLSAKCDTACNSYKAKEFPSSNSREGDESLQVQNATLHLHVFSSLEQGCLYEYMSMLLTKRENRDNPAEAEAFKNLQAKLDQFLANIDVDNPVTLLQAQMDMIAYENAVRVDKAK